MKNKCDTCALCLKKAALRNSHIISESFYSDLYEPPHRFSIVVAEKNAKDKYVQKGIREPLLCDSCEQLLGNRYEFHGAHTFRKLKVAARTEASIFTLDSIDHTKFKLFQLTQLWRMAVAKQDMFHKVVLPTHTVEQLRLMLFEGTPRRFDCFGVMMEAIVADDGNTFDAFMPAITVRIADYDFLLATFSGFSWFFCAHQSVSDERLRKYFVTEGGSVTVPIRQLRDTWHVQRFGDELESVGKL